MRRVALGIIGLALLLGGLALPFASEASWASFATGVLIKTGAVTLLFWLAYHQLVRLFEVVPPWLIGAGLLLVGTAIVFPKSILVVLGLFAAMIVLHVSGIFLAPFAAKAGTIRRKKAGTATLDRSKSDVPELKSKASRLKS